jgi:DNA-binding CsgD family transcriptional regulator
VERRSSEHLSARERAVLALIAKGQSNKRVAQTLKITPETVKSHLKRVFVKLGSKTRAEAVVRATQLGFLANVALLPLGRTETHDQSAERMHRHQVSPLRCEWLRDSQE